MHILIRTIYYYIESSLPEAKEDGDEDDDEANTPYGETAAAVNRRNIYYMDELWLKAEPAPKRDLVCSEGKKIERNSGEHEGGK